LHDHLDQEALVDSDPMDRVKPADRDRRRWVEAEGRGILSAVLRQLRGDVLAQPSLAVECNLRWWAVTYVNLPGKTRLRDGNSQHAPAALAVGAARRKVQSYRGLL
jgi:hypothetical protein